MGKFLNPDLADRGVAIVMIKGIVERSDRISVDSQQINVNGLDEMIKETVAAVHNVELIPEA